MATIAKVLRMDRINTKGEAPIRIRITTDRKPIYHPTGERVYPAWWDSEAEIVTSKHPNAKLINAKLDKIVAEIKGGLLREELQDRIVTPEVVKKKIRAAAKRSHDFHSYGLTLVEAWKDNKKESTREKYVHELNKIKEYAPRLHFSDITPGWLAKYEKHLRETRENGSNNINRSFRNLKTFFLAAIQDGIIQDNPFKKHPGPSYKAPRRDGLTASELSRFVKVLLEGKVSGADIVAGWFFVFSCYTGLRYSDCAQFNPEEHIRENKRILLSMIKTEEDVTMIITPKIREALKMIEPDIGKMPTNQECNRAVKEIAKAAKIKKKPTFHWARHTFGYNCAEANMPIEVAAKLMGHSNTKTTAVYYHISDQNADKWMMKMQG